MKCYNCGFENKSGVSFCHQCGVNLKNDDADVLNKEFKINNFVSIIVGLLFGFVFAFPVLIIGSVAGRVIDKIFN